MSELDPVGLEAAALDEAVESYRHMFAPGVSRESTFRNGWAARAAYLSVQGRDGSELDRLRDGMPSADSSWGVTPTVWTIWSRRRCWWLASSSQYRSSRHLDWIGFPLRAAMSRR